MCQVKDPVSRGTVSRLMWDGGHRVGDRRGKGDRRGDGNQRRSLKRLCENGCNSIWGTQHSSAMD